MSPTARTQEHLRQAGYLVANVERWNPYARRRQDLFGCIDTLALAVDPTPAGKVLAIQSTSGDHHVERIEKVRAAIRERPVLTAYFKIQVWSWRKTKVKRGGKKFVYKLRVEEIS
jgi:hypothetical protein